MSRQSTIRYKNELLKRQRLRRTINETFNNYDNESQLDVKELYKINHLFASRSNKKYAIPHKFIYKS